MFTFLEYIANKSISKKLIEKIGKYKIYSVDASEIRSLCQADDQFNHFGGHKEFKFIPDNEIWISNDISKHERFFLIQSGINQYERKGKDWYEYALRKEKAEREKVDGIKFDPKEKPPQTLYYKHFCNIGDVNVWLINGEVCRDIYKTDGIEGFNPEIYPWVPKNEIWVEKNLKSIDVIATVLHEYIESSLMKLKKMSYAKAHNIASKIDFQHRGKFDIKDIEALNRKKALEMAAKYT